MQYEHDVLTERAAAELPGMALPRRVPRRLAVDALRARARARGNVFVAGVAPAPVPARPAGMSPDIAPRFELAALPQVREGATPLRTGEDTARANLRDLPFAQLVQVLADPMMRDGLPRLVPLIKVSDVIPCLRAPDIAALVFPWLAPAQCKLLGPEVAALVGPYLPLAWTQLAHLPLETVVLVATETFLQLPATTLRRLPPAHQHYLAPYVKRVRTMSRDDHDRVLCQALGQILHLYAYKIIDPEHIPEAPQLRLVERDGALGAKAHELRWLVDSVMTDAVRAVQLGALRLPTVVVELRRSGAPALADELDRAFKAHKERRAWRYGGGLAYTQDRAIAVRPLRIASALELDAALHAMIDAVAGDAVIGDAVVGDAAIGVPDGVPVASTDPARPPALRIPLARVVTAITIELDGDPPAARASARLDARIRAQLGEPRACAIHEVRLRWASGATRRYRGAANAVGPDR